MSCGASGNFTRSSGEVFVMAIHPAHEARTQPRCGVAVMAKASTEGRAKTRLAAAVGAATAARLNTAFLSDITANLTAARAAGSITGYLAFGPPGESGFFDFAPAHIVRFAAWEPTFGETLKAAIRHMFAEGHDAACVLNSDSPTLPTSILVEAARALAEPGDRVVLGPSNDGGYYLLGMKTLHEQLFEGISWSTALVAGETLQRAADLGLDVHRLPEWYDVDDGLSFEILRAELSGEQAFGPAHFTPAPATNTRAVLAAMDQGEKSIARPVCE